MRIVRFVTDTNFVGTETVHFIKVPDDADRDYLGELLDDFITNDIFPQGGWEESSIEEAEEQGYDIDGLDWDDEEEGEEED